MIITTIIPRAIHRILSWLMIWLISLSLIIALILSEGVGIDRIHAANTTVEGLYIKFDKNLIVTVEHIAVDDTEPSLKSSSLKEQFEKLDLLLFFVSRFDVHTLEYRYKEGNVTLKGLSLSRRQKTAVTLDALEAHIYPSNKRQPIDNPVAMATGLYHDVSSTLETVALNKARIVYDHHPFELRNLRLKLGQKLDGTLEELILHPRPRDTEPVFAVPYATIIDAHRIALHLIGKVSLSSLKSGGTTLSLSYADDSLRVANPKASLVAHFQETNNTLVMTLDEAKWNNPALTLSGSIIFTPSSRATAALRWKGFKTNGTAAIALNQRQADITLTAEPVASLTPLVAALELDPSIGQWLTTRSHASSYQLQHLSVHLARPYWEPIPDSVTMRAYARNATLRFDPALPEVKADELTVRFAHDTLFFEPKNTRYADLAAPQASARIEKLIFTPESSILYVDLGLSHRYNDTLAALLKHYALDLPLRQTSGTTEAKMHLGIDLGTLDTRVRALIEPQGNYDFFGQPLEDVRGRVEINDANISFERLHIVYGQTFEGNLTALLRTDLRQMRGVVDIDHVRFGDNDRFLDIPRTQTDLHLDYTDKGTHIELPDQQINIDADTDQTIITLKDLSKIATYSPFLRQQQIGAGKAKLTHTALSDTLEARLTDWPTPFVAQGSRIIGADLHIEHNATTTALTTMNSRVRLFVGNRISADLRDIDLNLSALPSNSETDENSKSATIRGVNTKIYYSGARHILSDSFIFEHNGTKSTLHLTHGRGELDANLYGDLLKIQAHGLDDKFFRAATGFDGIKGGRFWIVLTGSKENFNASLVIDNARLSDIGAFNSIIGLLNAIPSLIIGNVNFGIAGTDFAFEKATIDLSYQNGQLIFSKIDIEGYHTDVKGTGTIDFNSGKIALDLQVSPMKALREIAGAIPVLHEILIGADSEGMSTEIQIRGTVDEPVVETFITHGILMAPANLIWRTVKMPSNLFKEREEK